MSTLNTDPLIQQAQALIKQGNSEEAVSYLEPVCNDPTTHIDWCFYECPKDINGYSCKMDDDIQGFDRMTLIRCLQYARDQLQ